MKPLSHASIVPGSGKTEINKTVADPCLIEYVFLRGAMTIIQINMHSVAFARWWRAVWRKYWEGGETAQGVRAVILTGWLGKAFRQADIWAEPRRRRGREPRGDVGKEEGMAFQAEGTASTKTLKWSKMAGMAWAVWAKEKYRGAYRRGGNGKGLSAGLVGHHEDLGSYSDQCKATTGFWRERGLWSIHIFKGSSWLMTSVEQWFSKLCMHHSHFWELVTTLGPYPVSDGIGLRWWRRMCTPSKFLGDADPSGLGPPCEDHWYREEFVAEATVEAGIQWGVDLQYSRRNWWQLQFKVVPEEVVKVVGFGVQVENRSNGICWRTEYGDLRSKEVSQGF